MLGGVIQHHQISSASKTGPNIPSSADHRQTSHSQTSPNVVSSNMAVETWRRKTTKLEQDAIDSFGLMLDRFTTNLDEDDDDEDNEEVEEKMGEGEKEEEGIHILFL